MILSVSMPLIFWTKMNDIRLASGYFLRLDACETIHPSPSNYCACLTTPFSPLYLVAQKWWSDASLDGVFAPKRNTFTGVHLPSLGRVISFRLPVFPFFAGRSSDKNKSLPPSFYWLVNRFCHKTSL
ncbi:hypothetical protein J4731_18515 [Providencia rettgeri]|nr:hypothetical protein [Providencia rettgeri]